MAKSPANLALVIDGHPGKEALDRTLALVLKWSAVRKATALTTRAIAEAAHPAIRSASPRTVRVFADADDLKSNFSPNAFDRALVVSLGGDGALLQNAHCYLDLDLPFLGVNLGSVGFNASTSPKVLPQTLDHWLRGKTAMTEHLTFEVSLMRNGRRSKCTRALNEVVVHKGNASRMIQIAVHQSSRLVFRYHADGVIVATPTGSTAYSLSAGGPIVHPAIAGMVVTGLNANTLGARSIVLGPEPLLLEPGLDSEAGCSAHIDGREHWPLKSGDAIAVEKGMHPLRLVHPPKVDYFATLRDKLRWSVSIKPVAGSKSAV